MYYWLVSWPQQRAKAVKSRGGWGWGPPGDAGSQRLNRQKSARAKMSAKAKKGRCKEGPSKKRGHSKCENPNRCKTGNLAASAQATNFGLSVTTCHQDLSVLSEWVQSVICISALEFAIDKRKFNLVTRRCKVWLGFWRFLVDQMMFTSRDQECDNRADSSPSRVKSKQNLILFYKCKISKRGHNILLSGFFPLWGN